VDTDEEKVRPANPVDVDDSLECVGKGKDKPNGLVRGITEGTGSIWVRSLRSCLFTAGPALSTFIAEAAYRKVKESGVLGLRPRRKKVQSTLQRKSLLWVGRDMDASTLRRKRG